MFKKTLAGALLCTTAAFAQQGPSVNTGAMDAPKTTTSATEAKTTDAAGLGAPVPGTTDGAHPPATAALHHRHRHHVKTVPAAPH
jgi:hypothetical protein